MESTDKYLCRTCMEGAGEAFTIFEFHNGVNIAEFLQLCVAVQLSKDDTLPHQICKACCNKIEEFDKFRKQVLLVDKKLRQPNSAVICNQTNIKCEERDTDSDHFDDIDDLPLAKYEIEVKKETTEKDTLANNALSQKAKYGKKAKVKEKKPTPDMTEESQIWLGLDNIKSEHDLTEHLLNSAEDAAIKDDIFKIEQTIFTCNTCNSAFPSKCSLNAHLRVHVASVDKVLSCTYCQKTFKKINHLRRHENVHRQGDIKKEPTTESERNEILCESNQAVHKCDKCPAAFNNLHSVIAHKRVHANPKRVLACSVCHKVFKKVSHLQRHESVHTEKQIHKCSSCTKAFSTEVLLSKHMATHSSPDNKCTICGKTFTQKSSLVVHLKIHSGEQPVFLCPVCGKNFNCNSNMKAHMKRHLRLKAFACEVCPKKFVSKGELNSHRITHTGHRAFSCERCGAAFTKSTSLTKHVQRLHLRLRPHPCDACDMKFSTRDHLKRHQRIHTGEKPYRCRLCERAFTQSGDLLKHTRTHLGDKLYSCSVCSESFRLKAELSLHLSDHRPVKLQDTAELKDASKQETLANKLLEVT